MRAPLSYCRAKCSRKGDYPVAILVAIRKIAVVPESSLNYAMELNPLRSKGFRTSANVRERSNGRLAVGVRGSSPHSSTRGVVDRLTRSRSLAVVSRHTLDRPVKRGFVYAAGYGRKSETLDV